MEKVTIYFISLVSLLRHDQLILGPIRWTIQPTTVLTVFGFFPRLAHALAWECASITEGETSGRFRIFI